MNIKNMKYLFVSMLLLFSLVGVVAVSEELTDEELALNCINESSEILRIMNGSDINTNRPEDIKELIINSYDAQMILKERGRNTDFSYTLSNCDEIKSIGYLAFSSRDEILGLKEFYSETISEGSNTQEIDDYIKKIDMEYKNERYEKIEELINEGYVLIIDFESKNSALNVFYESTRDNFKYFFIDNYKLLILILLTLYSLFLIFRRTIKRFILNLRLDRLNLRRDVVKNLIKNTQKAYFSGARISRGMYDVRLRKFSEIVRDIDRQILNIREDLLRNKSKANREGSVKVKKNKIKHLHKKETKKKNIKKKK